MNVSNEDLLLFYYSHGIISASDVVETSKEDLMTKILNKVHKFEIQPQRVWVKDGLLMYRMKQKKTRGGK